MPAYPSPPSPRNADGEPRRIGVEIEYGGLSVSESIKLAQGLLGGEVEKHGQHRQTLHAPGLGALEFELDMASRHIDAFAEKEGDDDLVRAITGEVVNWLAPVELVAPPLSVDDLHRLEPLIESMRDAGATGASHGAQTAYGMHLNVECQSLEADALLETLAAFALLEEWLRDALQIRFNRRLTGFVKPYPREYVDVLAQDDYRPERPKLFQDYLRHNPTRNRALDLTPIIDLLEPKLAQSVLGEEKRSARPTWHYRLPDAHADKPGWTPRRDWLFWRLIEQAAASPTLMSALRVGWREHQEDWTSSRWDWSDRCTDMLRAAGLIDAEGEPCA